jgi:multidrug efflux system membrane fusion protein
MEVPRPTSFDNASNAAVPNWRDATSEPRTRLIAGIVLLLVLIAAVWFFFGRAPAKEKRTPPAPVLVTRVTQKTVVVQEPAIGTVIANATVQLTPQVEGRLMSAEFKEGQLVHRGDVLFRIDPRPFQAARDSAAASLTAARAKSQRYQALLAQKAVSPQDADDARAAYLQAKAALDTAQLNLDFTVIRSPIDGKTGPILVQPGNLVSASGGSLSSTATTSTSGSPLVVITQIQPVKVSFSLPQSDLPRIQAQMDKGRLIAAVQIHGAPQTMHKAPVDFTSNAVSATTGTLELRATFPNTDSVLVPGQLVDVTVALADLAHVPVVPSNAVNVGPNGSYVYSVDKNRNAIMIPVQVLNDDGKIAAIKGNIKPGQVVITDGQMRVAPGKPVSVKNGKHGGNRHKA